MGNACSILLQVSVNYFNIVIRLIMINYLVCQDMMLVIFLKKLLIILA